MRPGLGERLASGLDTLRGVPRLTKTRGDTVDLTFAGHLAAAIGAGSVFSSDAWRAMSGFEEVRRTVLREAQDTEAGNGLSLLFPFLEQPVASPMVISQPNGSQQWPDMLVLFARRGLAVEFKSCQSDKITWNSGLPRRGGIYVFNGAMAKEDRTVLKRQGLPPVATTFFLGEHVIDEETRTLLKRAAASNKADAELASGLLKKANNPWGLYARPMFTCESRILGNPSRAARERETMDFARSFDWDPK